MVRFITFILIAFFLSITFAVADTPESRPDFSSLKMTNKVAVEKVIDGLTVLLKDGRIVRLSSLDIPGYVYPEPSAFSLSAKKSLEELLPPGTPILLYQTKKPKIGRENRMGHILAHLVTEKEAQWVQGKLIEEGLARAAPTPTNPEMTAELYAKEQIARDGKKGLWADEAFPVLSAEKAGNANGTFGVVEGTIQSSANIKNTLYLNYGADWKKDFTVTIPSTVRKSMVREGIDPLSLTGKTVRVRGWVREYNGPVIELEHPASLEILDKTPKVSQ